VTGWIFSWLAAAAFSVKRSRVRPGVLVTVVVATFHRSRPSPVAGVDWRSLDVRRRDDLAALAADTGPEAIINAAFRQADWAITADGGMHVAVAAAAVGARLVHVSSDLVDHR
jgi:dTDP-4-dehydrorhamnose reductase